jgi:hypothetical protein
MLSTSILHDSPQVGNLAGKGSIPLGLRIKISIKNNPETGQYAAFAETNDRSRFGLGISDSIREAIDLAIDELLDKLSQEERHDHEI